MKEKLFCTNPELIKEIDDLYRDEKEIIKLMGKSCKVSKKLIANIKSVKPRKPFPQATLQEHYLDFFNIGKWINDKLKGDFEYAFYSAYYYRKKIPKDKRGNTIYHHQSLIKSIKRSKRNELIFDFENKKVLTPKGKYRYNFDEKIRKKQFSTTEFFMWLGYKSLLEYRKHKKANL